MVAQPKVGLRGNEHQYPKDKGDQQPHEALFGILDAAAAAQREPRGSARQEKEKLHGNGVTKNDEPVQGSTQLVVLDIPGFKGIKDPVSMEGHQKQHHRYHPQPVNIPPALRHSRFVDSLSVHRFPPLCRDWTSAISPYSQIEFCFSV